MVRLYLVTQKVAQHTVDGEITIRVGSIKLQDREVLMDVRL